MRVATWNINSVRLRLDLVLRFLQEHDIDLLCLQETKAPLEAFPFDAFAAAGYAHRHAVGFKGYNGCAILSRLPLVDPRTYERCGQADARHIAARVVADASGAALIDVHCVYIPAGGDIPDPEANPKFAHKLAFMEEMTRILPVEASAADPVLLMGDLNVAPLEHDVWSHKQMLGVVSHTPPEVERLAAMQASLQFIDTARHFVPHAEKLYSWWSYRARDWFAADRGRRLDHIWATPPLLPHLRGTHTLKDARGWEPKPSDHVPVMLELEI